MNVLGNNIRTVYQFCLQWRVFDSSSNYGFAKLRHCDLKNALLAPWSLKTNALWGIKFNQKR